MRYRKEIKEVMLRMLAEKLDERLTRHGFKRNSRSLEYRRTALDTKHVILCNFESHPSSDPRADAHIYPWIFVGIPVVYELALKMAGDSELLGDPDKILSQPTAWAAPKDYHSSWYLTGEDQFMNAGSAIGDYIERWVLPLLNDLSSLRGFVHAFEMADRRIAIFPCTTVFIAAAYLLLGKREVAMQTLEQKLATPYLKTKYSKAFEFVQKELQRQ
jgi:hypothetical protein